MIASISECPKIVNADPEQVAPSKDSVTAGAKPLLFLVDDDEMLGEVVETILSIEGFDCRFFSDPLQAFEAFTDATEKPAAVLCDFVMPPLNGMELIQRLKTAQPDVRTILYSGNVGENITEEYAHKPDAFLRKPFLPKNLVATVNAVLGI